ncbi:hypothetical protein P280DRAFT_55674 [Massarina eburnea CBS 473.64]|uniref:Rhodopsin domain-containing protein n=1 Tax=Massarina eburnea CBS 473.64 TaxID=1395130 RepID=A0A6A6RUF4_9PLEO|nr:hypothetical protein P280DRAFT_55674 [Massarina eburnea CBS 473.64]
MADNEASLEAQSQAPLLVSLSIIFGILSTTSVALRLYTRKRILGIIGPDDVTIVVAEVLAISVSVITILQAHFGLGRHTQFVDWGLGDYQNRLLYSNTLIYNASQTITKVSFLILYRRIFPGGRTAKVCFYLLAFIILWGTTQEFLVAFCCAPLSIFFPVMVGHCIYQLPVWYLTSILNIVTDFMIFIIPVSPVLKLQLRVGQKIMLLCLFCLGFFTCAISLVRLSVLHKGATTTTDPFWDNAPASYWSVVELNCGILCSCLPTLRPLIQKLVPQFFSTDGHTGSYTGYTGGLTSSYIGNSTRRTGSAKDTHALSTIDPEPPSPRQLEDGIYVHKEGATYSSSELARHAGDIRPSFGDTASQTTEATTEATTRSSSSS